MKYADYSLHDFVMDAYFQQWVTEPTEEINFFWNGWLAQHPEKKPVLEEAKAIIRLIRFKDYAFPEDDFDHVWERLQVAALEQEYLTAQQKLPHQSRIWRLHPWTKVAATLALLITMAALFYFFGRPPAPPQYTTQYGETKHIMLPDSSFVTLNANSTLKLKNEWGLTSSREAWLEGEAFFEILKKPNQGNAQFIVHSKDLAIKVLGTRFNVNTRRDKTRVVLNSGKVQVYRSANREKVEMLPGDLVEYSHEQHHLTKSKVNTQLYTSWKDEELLFDQTPLYEIAHVIEDNYGLQVVIVDDELRNKEFTGGFPSNDIDIILQSLAALYEIKISREDDTIILTKQ